MTRYNAITDGTEEVRETMETLIALQAGTIDPVSYTHLTLPTT